MGLESYAALNKTGVEFFQFGAVEAAIEAAKCGLSPLVVCVENEASRLITRLEQERIHYELCEVTRI
jgi:predicted transcriptional regulator